MSAHIREALRELERDVAGLRLSPSAEVRARGRARSRRRAVALAGVAAVVVGGGAATLPALGGPASPVAAASSAGVPSTGAPSAGASVECWSDAPVRLDVVFRPGTSAPRVGEVGYRIAQARGDVGLRCGGQSVASRPDATGRLVTSVLLAAGEDAAPIRAAVEGLPGVERVVVTGGR
ncbi:hypothetical protein [Micromonospora sp. NBS 11-29]|uniref:hypothetical protein n=1 Tax=Micromonospora sp. NBS 11-29 TaxID=1960879 RepID=UPI000B78ADB7|nr:hypothetical protein [Micromonospora sp. NBS 11-29]